MRWTEKHDIEDVPGYEGIGQCRVCKGAEAELPKHCPGEPLTLEEKDDISNGFLEFLYGRWWEPRGRSRAD